VNAQRPDPTCASCDVFKTEKTGSILAVVLGGAALGVGIPLMLTAADDAPSDAQRRGADVPVLRVGVGGGSLTWRF